MAVIPRPSYSARAGEAVRVFLNDDLSFAIGNGRITITSNDVIFVDAVTSDIGLLAHMPEGEAELNRGDALGHPVKIAKPDPPTEPPNAWIVPDDLAAAISPNAPRSAQGGIAVQGTGVGCGSTVVYDPADWPREADPGSPTSVEVLLIALRQANMNAEGRGNPSAADWGSASAGKRR